MNAQKKRMSSQLKRLALQYVRNTRGTATLQDFYHDHEPAGPILWESLFNEGCVFIEDDGGIHPTLKGQVDLEKLYGRG